MSASLARANAGNADKNVHGHATLVPSGRSVVESYIVQILIMRYNFPLQRA